MNEPPAPSQPVPPAVQPSPSWAAWQLVDSAFPIGGFAHSLGLEASHQAKLVTRRDDLQSFLQARLHDAARGSLVIMLAAHRGSLPFAELDQRCDAFLTNAVAHRASQRQGLALLTTARQSFPTLDLRVPDDAVRLQASPGHLAPILGHITARLKLPEADALRLAAFTELRTVLSAAVRLNVTGPLDAQRLLHDLEPHAHAAAHHATTLSLDDIHQSHPLLELTHTQHDRLYSKLFQS